MMVLVYSIITKQNYFVIMVFLKLFRWAKCAADTVTDQILYIFV